MTDDAISYPTPGQPVGVWLDELGSAAPAPGGGAVAAMSAATAAALVEMVGNLTVGRAAYAPYEEQVTAVRDAAHGLRRRALEQLDEDATAFRALMTAYRLPRQTGAEQAARQTAIQAATRRAAAVPLDVAATAAAVIELAGQLPGRSNPNVLSDVGVAAVTAAAAIEAAAVNVDVNLASLADAEVKAGADGRAGPPPGRGRTGPPARRPRPGPGRRMSPNRMSPNRVGQARIIDGRAIAAAISEQTARDAAALRERGVTPVLAVVVPTDDPGAAWYVRSLQRLAGRVGVECQPHQWPSPPSAADLLAVLTKLSADPVVHGIICQTPLPPA